ncbi:hypothetical protein Metli_0934 [Methanofollis liminatans DSM 4140]|jgi:hypothetical protein|uniref:Uncharacterized protein n=1 Tax=Methanofollis liminatans DSM 4140 TaxID=28892 RepID=J1L1K4_9EURY|nr:hypothetical protein [Methanofollis liminatans]EJG06892.1 hypothetical protein Metli_0934 [Methanofollis liminatans DSM 4140]
MAEEEELFDLVIPPGVPRSVIRAIIQKYDVELVERSQPLYYANMSGDVRDLLAFRGKKEVVQEAEKEMRTLVLAFIGEE